jgi:hypothetical protein
VDEEEKGFCTLHSKEGKAIKEMKNKKDTKAALSCIQQRHQRGFLEKGLKGDLRMYLEISLD